MKTKRPFAVTALACLYLLVGIAGFVGHFSDLKQPDGISIEVTEFMAVLAGAFMLRGHNWARWLAVAWIAFHVAISVHDPIGKLGVHIFLLVVIAYLLFRRDAGKYFRGTEIGT